MTIKTHVPDINPDLYCYDTGLTFGQDIAEAILEQVRKDETVFEKRNNYYAYDDYKALARQIGADKTRELIRRKQQVARDYPNDTPITFRQYFVRGEWADRVLAEVPDWLKLNDKEPDCMLQVGGNGSILPTHKGHYRKCSLFMLLQGSGQETCWYRNKEDFEVIDPLRIPDLDKIEKVVSVQMEPRRWYLFNHYEWHSVHRYGVQGVERINIGIDYNSIFAPDLLKMVKDNS